MQLVQRMAEQLPSNKLKVVFLINNYHEVMFQKSSRCLVGASEHVLEVLETTEDKHFVSLIIFRRPVWHSSTVFVRFSPKIVTFVQTQMLWSGCGGIIGLPSPPFCRRAAEKMYSCQGSLVVSFQQAHVV